MDINGSNLKSIFTATLTTFNKQFEATPTDYQKIAMTVKSTTAANEYPRLDDLPGIREWLGDRAVNSLSASTYTIKNRKFENTIGLSRDNIEDDQLGFFSTAVAQLAQDAASFPDQLIFPLFKNGDKTLCYDGQSFFDTDHPGYGENGQEASVSNFAAGSQPSWYLIDDTKVIKPMIYQERKPFKLVSKDSEEDDNVFMKSEYLYGVDGRCNAGFGLWQLAYKSNEALTPEAYAKARTAMTTIRKRNGQVINIRPTKLLVPPQLEGAARKLLNAELIDSGNSNIWRGSAEIVVIPLLG
ncbi:Mu-like prophage major head subunit gpT family protein [Candidatus Tokpelaia sp.]|uniref:Mu-like prophage major head subunit gpT family protein n=1 Tax=Candidatus Tokpelaia sp. TaxID=2233777 RepID=UPI00123AEC4A|nr:Mu-like prophage major head subunit gpT family protein [Candidatus Tokpelaia sp.]KAA6404508.1 hypothetical protein DPQ22_09770 [Candidatus Tokpelaia sp.]